MAFRKILIPMPCDFDKFSQRLSEEISESFSEISKPYKGTIYPGRFKIWDNLNMRAGFEAVTYGKFESLGDKCFLRISQRVPVRAIVLTIFVYGFLLYNTLMFGFDLSATLLLFFAPIILDVFTFFPYARKTESKLRKLIQEIAK